VGSVFGSDGCKGVRGSGYVDRMDHGWNSRYLELHHSISTH
jgi:hypothetical protein